MIELVIIELASVLLGSAELEDELEMFTIVDIIVLKDGVVLPIVIETEPAVDVLKPVLVKTGLEESNVTVLRLLEAMTIDEIDSALVTEEADPVIGPETPVGVNHFRGGACAVRLVDNRPWWTWI